MTWSLASAAKLPIRTKLAYGLGQAAEGMKNYAFELFLFFYFTQVLGLTGTLAGLALLVALLFDAVTDPLEKCASTKIGTRTRLAGPWS